ncbi:MAG: tyrosine-type recombinase/integrase, partial [Phycisphaerae bacterium]|nr:tyrosine-type recombinase/integrase [Phycisphaerae bacterium]
MPAGTQERLRDRSAWSEGGVATLIRDPDGTKRVQVQVRKGFRPSIRLGRIDVHSAEKIRRRIEALVIGRLTGGFDPETARWLAGLDDAFYARIARTGLVPPRDRTHATLGKLLDAFFETLDVKPQTAIVYGQTRASLEEHFGSSRLLAAITTLDADRWHKSMRARGLADATISKRIKTARQVFRQGLRWKMVAENPFSDIKGGSQTNRARMYFVTREEAAAVLAACPDAQWRLIFALSRYAGLRCPSEHLLLRWQDVNWSTNRMLVTSPKTEGNPGGESRVVPIFPELRPFLLDAFEQAEPGREYVITRYRQRNCNLRTQLLRIISRAGVRAWPKLFHNLRSSCQTELEERHPTHVVCAWLGNSPAVARAHYLQVRES